LEILQLKNKATADLFESVITYLSGQAGTSYGGGYCKIARILCPYFSTASGRYAFVNGRILLSKISDGLVQSRFLCFGILLAQAISSFTKQIK
jgi:hypothetical protein